MCRYLNKMPENKSLVLVNKIFNPQNNPQLNAYVKSCCYYSNNEMFNETGVDNF